MIKKTVHSLQHAFNNISLLKKIFIIILVSNIVFAGAASVAAIYFVTEANRKMLYRATAENLSYSGTRISSYLSSIEQISYFMLADSSVQNSLYKLQNSPDEQERAVAFKSLYWSAVSYFTGLKQSYVKYIVIECGKYLISSDMSLSKGLTEDIRINLSQCAYRAAGAPYWMVGYYSSEGMFMVRAVRQIKNLDLGILGRIYICVDFEKMLQEAASSLSYEGTPLFVISSTGNIFYKPEGMSDSTIKYIRKNMFFDAYRIMHIQNHEYFAVKGRIPRIYWSYISLIPYDRTAQTIMYTCLVYSLIIGLGIVFSIIVSYQLIQSIAKHINFLMEKIRAFRGEREQLPVSRYDYSGRKDEIGILHQQFDRMVSEINELIEKNYKSGLLMKEAQLTALENQINPHFLYNTLESVNWRAKMIGAETISQMVESLGSLLRITLSPIPGDYTLQKELDLVQYYVTIQKLRFEDRLNVTIDCAEELQSCIVPKLSIQPLVENAIHYGLENSVDDCIIRIYVHKEGTAVMITVSNNGSHFEDDILAKLAAGTIQQHRTGIGLLNIDRRVKLACGAQYGLSFYNKDEMAYAVLTLPFNAAQERQNDASDNSR